MHEWFEHNRGGNDQSLGGDAGGVANEQGDQWRTRSRRRHTRANGHHWIRSLQLVLPSIFQDLCRDVAVAALEAVPVCTPMLSRAAYRGDHQWITRWPPLEGSDPPQKRTREGMPLMEKLQQGTATELFRSSINRDMTTYMDTSIQSNKISDIHNLTKTNASPSV